MRNYNIFHVDAIIKDKILSEISSLDSMRKELEELQKVYKDPHNPNNINAKQQQDIIRNRIRDSETTFKLAYYRLRTEGILEQYRSLLVTENSQSFVCTDKQNLLKEDEQRSILMTDFINIARDYINVENFSRKPDKLICPACFSDEFQKPPNDESVFVCGKCSTEINVLDDTPSFKDTDRINMTSRYTYSRRGHFIDAMKEFQGKHNIDSEVLRIVTNKLLKEIRYNNLNPKNVTKDQLYMFLSDKRESGHYRDLNLLHHIISGQNCPDFSMLEGKLLELFEEQEKALAQVMMDNVEDDRVNSINVYYKLYKLLQKVGYKCRFSEFYILKTKTKEDEHDTIMKKAWKLMKWTWIETE
jgi:Poxvirus Late Transcription Factor VLTF3 like